MTRHTQTQVEIIIYHQKTGFKRLSLSFLVYKQNSDSDIIWPIELIRHLKIPPNTSRIFNLK